MDVSMVARQVGVGDPVVIAKAREYVRLASLRVLGGLGQGEVCKPSICLELACSSLWYELLPCYVAMGALKARITHPCSTGAKERPPREKFIRFGCTTAK
eukprot:2670-Pelagomonas_calceolata.AAC.1